jgi:DNA-directed RNA polymerase subunit RPC12/RpoP
MTYLNSIKCPQCEELHYLAKTIKDDYTCLYCGKDMKTGEQITEGIYDIDYTDKGIDIHKKA